MPEWKSVALDGDEPADSPGAGGQDGPDAGGPSPDEFALKWGTEVQPVTIERIAAVLEGDGLPVATSEFVAATQVEEGNFQIHREPADCPWAQVELRLLVQGAELADLDRIANDWNAAHLQPTVFPVPEAGQPLLVAASRFFVGEGMSDRQIHAMIRRGVVVGLSLARELAQAGGDGTGGASDEEGAGSESAPASDENGAVSEPDPAAAEDGAEPAPVPAADEEGAEPSAHAREDGA